MERIRLCKMEANAYEHPEDRETLKVLKGFSCFESVIKSFMDWNGVKADYVVRKASNFHVTKETCPELNQLMDDAISILNIDDVPRVYLEWGYNINGYTWGYRDTTMMVLNTGVIDLMDDMEQTFVIGHELGHIKSKHVIYHTLAKILTSSISNIPIIGSVPELFVLALTRWSRMSEFTADRAGLLACQDVNAALRAIIKMSGVPHKYFDKINVESFLKEAESLQKDLSFTDKAFEKVLNAVYNDHPWVLIRALELKKWVDSGEYEQILNEYKAIRCPVCGHYTIKSTTVCPKCDTSFNL